METFIHPALPSAELALIQSACLGVPLAEETWTDVRGERLLALARWHQVRPQVFAAVQHFSASWVGELKQEVFQLTLSNLVNTRETLSLLTILKKNQISAYAYKGCVWAEWLYGQQSRREFGDIDLLVAKDDVNRCLDLFRSVGYAPDPYREYLLTNQTSIRDAFFRTDYHIPMEKRVGAASSMMLEVHWQVAYPRLCFSFPSKEWSEYKVQMMIQSESVRCFTNEYQLLLLIMHHGGKENWAKLKYVADLAAYMKRYGAATNWPLVKRLAEKKGLWKLVRQSLGLLKALGMPWSDAWPEVEAVSLKATILKNWEEMPPDPKNSTWMYLKQAITIREHTADQWEVAKAHLRYMSELKLLLHKSRWYAGKS
ncbi:nucleotidyltransferase domain-containing protein [Arundinibacter roseus]|uniref:Nucleotidyltransferase family protein n=1 Tax=Arundinibacter roseus TaxID=2070510 RepID=A0A4R4K1H2_9BACT|nr:nucleotidyltransferase family protein [Arundinibacter roseus]TDB61144.1 hypothetical protein EZE20_19965 [Arundinibacter roseus]